MHTHNPLAGLRQRKCRAAGGQRGVETGRAGGEWIPEGPPMKVMPGFLVHKFSTGFQVNKF